ncbi:3554_t:CDS:1, partial [Funneliformis mosseae]
MILESESMIPTSTPLFDYIGRVLIEQLKYNLLDVVQSSVIRNNV